jgi:hypothetical protein
MKIRTSNLWRAAFVRPFEEKTAWKKHMCILLSYGFGLALIVASVVMLIDDALRRPVPLDQMLVTSGRLSHVSIQRRSSSYLVITTKSGTEERLFARWLPHTDLKLRIGQHVMIWSQTGFELFNGVVQKAAEVRLSEKRFVLGYSDRRADGIQFDEKNHYWFLAMLTLGLFLITKPVWKHRRQDIGRK